MRRLWILEANVQLLSFNTTKCIILQTFGCYLVVLIFIAAIAVITVAKAFDAINDVSIAAISIDPFIAVAIPIASIGAIANASCF